MGSALGGDFFGWEFVLYGGFLSALSATGFAAIFYWLYAGAITELAARFKTSGGSFDFVKAVLGRRAASLMAVLGLLKLILANSALALAISSYLMEGGMPRSMQPPCWVCTYSLFTVLDSIGVRQSANIQVMATVLCVLILIFYSGSSLRKFSYSRISRSGFINDGLLGYCKGFPFALQFFDGFEEVPLLMGYAINPEKTIPDAIVSSYLTVFAIALMILFSGSGVTPSNVLIRSEAPLMNGIDSVYGHASLVSEAVANLVVLGLLVNFFAFVLFASQQMQAVAAAGQLPSFLAYRHPVHGAPINASICSSVVGLVLTAGFAYVFDESAAQDTLVTAALMPAVLGYGLLLECIVQIREIERRQSVGDVTPHDLVILGRDPGSLRFHYGMLGAKFAQSICVLFVIGLLVLACISVDFRWGLILLCIFGSSSFYCMETYMKEEISENKDYEEQINLMNDGGDRDGDGDIEEGDDDTMKKLKLAKEEGSETDTEDDSMLSQLEIYHI